MTFGEKLKKLRLSKEMTQKDLADKLNVTFQTISKWENNTNEPDFTTLKEIAKIFSVSIEYLFNDEDEEIKEIIKEEKVTSDKKENRPIERKVIAKCGYCKRDIYQGEYTHQIEEQTSYGKKEILTVCHSCFQKEEEKAKKKKEEILKTLKEPIPVYKKGKISGRDDAKALKWAIGVGIVILILSLIGAIGNYSKYGIVVTIITPIITTYMAVSTVYCILSSSIIGEIFASIACWSIKFPGIIFTFDLDGFAFLIAMKILFAILGILISIFAIIIAFFIASIVSFFAFIPMLIINKK